METSLAQSDVIQRLFARINYERQSPLSPGDFKLSNMIRLLERIGNPQLHYPVIHVAGTKGKGSVCAFIGSILGQVSWPDSRQLKIGVYASPHLERINQRIMISGTEISDRELSAVLTRLQPVVNEFDVQAQTSETRQLTFFEVITAAAFQAFSDAEVDVVVLEVGMGGRLDSTNVCQSNVCMITNISLDHTRQLGSTVAEIAAEKAGIIKPGVPVINGAIEPESRAVIDAMARDREAPILHLGEEFSFACDPKSSHFSFQSSCREIPQCIENLRCGMIGEHQRQNAALAIAACQQLAFVLQPPSVNATSTRPRADLRSWETARVQTRNAASGSGRLFAIPPIRESHIRDGLALASLPGRCEVFGTAPLTILDMAHNVASTTALAATIRSEMPEFLCMKERTLIFATSREKDVPGMIASLAELFDRIIVTQYRDNPRGRSAAEVYEIAVSVCHQLGLTARVSIAETPESAWRQLVDVPTPATDRAICMTGSAFLVAELRPLVAQWSKDRC